jgi:hypothetical protein
MSEVIQIERFCSICGSLMVIDVTPEGHYFNGHYFGRDIIDNRFVELWECNTCYGMDDPPNERA